MDDTKRFKFAIWIYKKTGYVSKIIVQAELDYLVDNYENIITDYLEYKEKSKDDEDLMYMEDYVGLKIGLWQCKVGLYRSMDSWIKPMFGYKGMLRRKLKRLFK